MQVIEKLIKSDSAPNDRGVVWFNTLNNHFYIFDSKDGWIDYIEKVKPVVDDALSEDSLNALQNKVLTEIIGGTSLDALETASKNFIGAINELLRVLDSKVSQQEMNTAISEAVDESLEEIQDALENLPDGQAVSAQVALNTAAIENLKTNKANKTELERKANKDGYYQQLTAGLSENLVDTKGTGSLHTFTRRTSCGDESIADDGAGLLQSLRGNSIVWNQLVRNGNFADGTNHWVTESGVTFTVSDGVAHITKSTSANNGITQSLVNVVGHKYFMTFQAYCETSTKVKITFSTNLEVAKTISAGVWETISGIVTASVYQTQIYVLEESQTYHEFLAKNVNVIDLTLMFGEGNEPTTVAEFKTLFSKLYYPYNEGTLISNAAQVLETNGFNQWDEEWEVGLYNSQGQKTEGQTIRCKNFVPVFPGVTYYAKTPALLTFRGYDANKNYVGTVESVYNNTFVIPNNVAYITFFGNDAYWNTHMNYNHDICINLSLSGYRNGEYEPYWKQETPLNLDSFQVKDGQGNITTITGGLKSAGSAYDEIVDGKKYIKRVGSVDMGRLEWLKDGKDRMQSLSVIDGKYYDSTTKPNLCCVKYLTDTSGHTYSHISDKIISIRSSLEIVVYDSAYSDAATFKHDMNGVMLYYELATPEEYELVEPINTTYKVADFGTETIQPLEPDAQGNPQTAPFKAIIKYNDDFTRKIATMEKNFTSKETIDALLATLGNACGGTFTKTWDSTNGKWTFQFTPNNNQNE